VAAIVRRLLIFSNCRPLTYHAVHYYTYGRNGDFAMQAPMVLGHEAAGVVTAVGPGVKNLVPGQRVAIEAGIMCGHCEVCKRGRYNLCKSMRFCSSAKTFPHLDGTLQDRMNHPAHVLHPYVLSLISSVPQNDAFDFSPFSECRLPDNCTFEQGALAEPLSVLLHASRRADLSPGQTVLVLGVGTIGLLACALAKSLGASHIVAIDMNQARLDFAKSNGFASQIFAVPAVDKAKTTDEQLRRAKENVSIALAHFGRPEGFDVVFECTGAEPCIQMSIHVSPASVPLIDIAANLSALHSGCYHRR
jgi:L-iditol 2-dehydrogenase